MNLDFTNKNGLKRYKPKGLERIKMNGYLRVNTFLRDVAFINCQNIKTVYFHVNYFEYCKGKRQTNMILFHESLVLLRDEATQADKKLLGNEWGDFRFSRIMHSYVVTWSLYNETAETILHIYSSNIPGLYKERLRNEAK